MSEIERVQTDARDRRRALRSLQRRLVAHDAAALVTDAQAAGDAVMVVATLSGHDPGSLKAVATQVAHRPGHVAALTSDGAPVTLVVARAGDVDLDAAAVVRAVLDHWGGRGGGRPDIAQGGGLDADPAEVSALARQLLSRALTLGA